MDSLTRRRFLQRIGLGTTTAALLGAAPVGRAESSAPAQVKRPLLMVAGHQFDHSDATLQALAAFGVTRICSGRLGREVEKAWTVDALSALRKQVESFGIELTAVPLPLSSREIAKVEIPEIMLAKDPERDRAIEDICTMIRNVGRAGISMVTYNLTFLGVVRSGLKAGRGGAKLESFDYEKTAPDSTLTEAGKISEEIYWDRIRYFLKRIVPVAEEAKVKLACHPQDPGMPRGQGWRGVETVLGSVEGLRHFLDLHPSPNHGLNFCQGSVSEMLEKPGEQIYDVIREFGQKGKIFNVHFRNIRGGFLKFEETFPDDGDVDMPRALRTYREIGYDGMIMPDHVPQITGDPQGQKAFAFCFGYIQALLQVLRRES